MPVESATYISQLDVTKPAGSDSKAEGDDQLRLLKSTVKATFPNFTAAPLNATQAQIDKLVTSVAVNASAPANSVQVDASGNVGVGAAPVSMDYGLAGHLAVLAKNTYDSSSDRSIAIGSNNAGSVDNGQVATWRLRTTGNAAGQVLSFEGMVRTVGWTEFVRMTGAGSMFVGHVSGTASATRYVNFGLGGTEIGSISQNGSTGVSYNTTSDYRLKNNPRPLTGSGAFIDALEPTEWEWVQDGSRGAGFIAHKFQAVSPSSVNGEQDAVDADGNPIYQSMQASSPEVMANIVAELQSLRARVAALEAA